MMEIRSCFSHTLSLRHTGYISLWDFFQGREKIRGVSNVVTMWDLCWLVVGFADGLSG